MSFIFNYPDELVSLKSRQDELNQYIKEGNHKSAEEIQSVIETKMYVQSNRVKEYFENALALDGVLLDGDVNFSDIENKRYMYFKENYDKYKNMNIGFNTFRQSYTPERWTYNTNCPNGEEYGFIYLLIDKNTASSLTIGN